MSLAENDLLSAVAEHPEFTAKGARKGVIYLPFCLHCLKEIVASSGKLSKYYSIAFLHKDELNDCALWTGTQSIDSGIMLSVFGKVIGQEEIYCVITEQQIKSMEDEPRVTKVDVLKFVETLDDISSIRFIALELLPV